MSDFLRMARQWLFNFHLDARLGRTPIWTAVILIFATTGLEGVFYTQHQLLQTIGVDASPSVEAAHRIKNYGAQLVADLVLELDAPTGANYDLVKDSVKQQRALDAAVQYAMVHITYLDDNEHLHPGEPQGELGPVTRLQEDITLLEQDIGKARVLHERNDGAVLSTARDVLNNLLVQHIIPDADALAMVNQAHFDHAYENREVRVGEALTTVVIVGGITLLLLVVSQVYLNFWGFRRAINPFWLAGSVLALFFFAYAGIAVERAGSEEYNAGTNAYPSVVALLDARAHALEARSEAAMILLDREPTENIKHVRRFQELMDQVGKTDGVHSFDDGCAQAKAGKKVTYITGALAVEFNNVTFPQELDAACAAASKFGEMVKVGNQIRDLENRGLHDQAVAHSIGNEPGDLVYAFNQFNDESGTGGALGTALKINQDAQNASIQTAFAWINPLESRVPEADGAIELLVILGMFFTRWLTNPARFARRLAATSA